MKKMLGLTVCALSLLAFASTAQSGGVEASGDFTFAVGTATGSVNFASQFKGSDQTLNGQISFNATIDVSSEECQLVEVPGGGDNTILVPVCEPTGNTSPTPVTLNFVVDCMLASDNRAAMSGTIVGDSPFAGQHTILAVENASQNDGFTWGVYKTKVVNTNAKDYDLCPNYTPPGDCGEFDCPPPPTCADDTGATLTWAASDYELCPYPPPSDTENFVPTDPHNYACFTGAPDPNPQPAGIPVLATETITHCGSFPLFTYPMSPIPHGGGNKLTVKINS